MDGIYCTKVFLYEPDKKKKLQLKQMDQMFDDIYLSINGKVTQMTAILEE